MKYDKNSNSVKFGDLCQEIVIKFLEESGWEWIAGERYSEVVNEKKMIFGKISETIIERGVPKLVFYDSEGIKNYILMPDELLSKENSREFFEVKGRDFDNGNKDRSFWEKKSKIDSYRNVKSKLKVPVWIVICIKKDNKYSLYISDIDDAFKSSKLVVKTEKVKDEYGDFRHGNKFYVYEWKSPQGFIKLSKNPLPENYLDL